MGVLLWLKAFISKENPGIYYDADPMPIYNWIYQNLSGPSLAILSKIIAFLIVLMEAIILNGIANQGNILGFRSYLPGLFFILITANFPEFQILHPLLLANFFLLIAWERVSDIIEKSNTVSSFFNSAFFIGLATLFYPNYVYFLAIIALSTVLNRLSSAREFVMIIIGFITVWYFYLSINYIFYNKIQFSGIEPSLSFSTESIHQLKSGQIIFLVYIGFLLLTAGLLLSSYMSNVKIQIRRNLKFLFSWFLLGIFIFIFTKSSIETIYVLAVPISMLFSVFFLNIKNKWLAETAWLILLTLSIINQFLPELF